jgi:two-component system, cell cycle sensor histidine kinase and response regulator CckA
MQTILLIESDPANLLAQSLILRCFGYTVLEAASRGEVWRVCHEHQGPIHIVLTKAILDGCSSSEFIARLQCLYPEICVLFVSDATSMELADRRPMHCEYTVLQKPFRPDGLADAIKGLLDGAKARAVSSPS